MTALPSIPVRELPKIAWRRVVREVRKRTAPSRPNGIKVGQAMPEVAKHLRERKEPRFFAVLPENAVLLSEFFPDAYWQTIEEADSAKIHIFNIFNSGPKDLGKEIKWHTDFKHGHTWPKVHYTRLTLVNPDGGYDVKVPWELSRFHHGLRLGQAYLYTGDEEYAEELINQITHWIKDNPHPFGVNWAGPMDVAIRVVNWIWAVYLIFEAEALTDDFLALWLTSLKQHGDHLMAHLEDGWPRTNHLIANLTGLAYLGILFPELDGAANWCKTGLNGLWAELERQVYPDGLDYEASLSYHRLVTEMALSVAALCIVNDLPLSPMIEQRLTTMLDAAMVTTGPDGTTPQFGDVDNGRLHPLGVSNNPLHAASDFRHLLALGSLVLEREMPEWAGYTDPAERGWSVAAGDEWQDAFWFFPSDAAARYTETLIATRARPDNVDSNDWVSLSPGLRVRARILSNTTLSLEDVTESRELQAGGVYVMRSGDTFMAVDAGDIGQAGMGGHAHNDTLSFTLSAYGQQFLVDPGTFVYTANPHARNAYRATSSHNTLQVGDEEINRFPESGELFRLQPDAAITLHRWVSNDEFDLLDASHNGYSRLTPGIVHRRQIYFDKRMRLWVLHDALQPARHTTQNGANGILAPEIALDAKLHFHFAPGLQLRQAGKRQATIAEGPDGVRMTMLPLGDFSLKAKLAEGWFSPGYGYRERAPIVRYHGSVTLPADFVILLYPHRVRLDRDAARATGRQALMNMRRALSPTMRSAPLPVR